MKFSLRSVPFLSFAAPSHIHTGLLDGLVSYYQFTANYNDATATGNTLTNTHPAAITLGAGKLGEPAGLYFQATTTNSCVQAASASVFSPTPSGFTVQGWVYSGADPANRTYVSKWNTSSTVGQEYWVSASASFANPRLSIRDGGNNLVTVTAIGSLAAGWHHIAAGHDTVNNLAWISLNNVRTTAPCTGYQTGTTSKFRIGEVYDGGSTYYFSWISEVAFWSRSLSVAEIGYLYNSGAGLAYPFGSYG